MTYNRVLRNLDNALQTCSVVWSENNLPKDVWYADIQGDKISYLRERDVDDYLAKVRDRQAFYTEKCQTMKPGKFLFKLGITDAEQVNKLISFMQPPELSIVYGEQIDWAYNMNYNAQDTGTLSTSCMRDSGKQKFFELYRQNSKMLVAMKSGKVIGRALIWEGLELRDGTKIPVFLDRVYGKEKELYAMHKFAFDQGWFVKEHQNYTSWTIKDKNEKLHSLEGCFIKLDVPLPLSAKQPYMDTLDTPYIKNEHIYALSAFGGDSAFRMRSLHGGNGTRDRCRVCGEYADGRVDRCWEHTEKQVRQKKCKRCGKMYTPTFFGQTHQECTANYVYKCKEHGVNHIARTKKEFTSKSCGGHFDNIINS